MTSPNSRRWQRGERAWCLCSPVVLRGEQPATVARGGKVPTLELDGVTHLCPTADPAPRRLGRPPAGEPLVRLSVTLPERQVAELHAESARAGVSVSALISDALETRLPCLTRCEPPPISLKSALH